MSAAGELLRKKINTIEWALKTEPTNAIYAIVDALKEVARVLDEIGDVGEITINGQ